MQKREFNFRAGFLVHSVTHNVHRVVLSGIHIESTKAKAWKQSLLYRRDEMKRRVGASPSFRNPIVDPRFSFSFSFAVSCIVHERNRVRASTAHKDDTNVDSDCRRVTARVDYARWIFSQGFYISRPLGLALAIYLLFSLSFSSARGRTDFTWAHTQRVRSNGTHAQPVDVSGEKLVPDNRSNLRNPRGNLDAFATLRKSYIQYAGLEQPPLLYTIPLFHVTMGPW